MIKKVSGDVFFNHEIPKKTNTYTPVTNLQLDAGLRDRLEKKGYSVTGRGYRANSKRTQFIGMLTIDQPEKGICKMIAYRNSTDKSMAVSMTAGALVMASGNTIMNGEIFTYRKHTSNVLEDLEELMDKAIDRVFPQFKEIQDVVEQLKDFTLSKERAYNILADLYFDKNMVSITQLGVIKDSVDNDKEFALKTDTVSLWQVYNIVMNATKHAGVLQLFQQHIEVHRYFEQILLTP